MADLATLLLRIVTRAFYASDYTLVIDALITHSTLSEVDLMYILGMQTKPLRKLCGKLREDGLLSVQTRAEKKTDGSESFYNSHGQGKERVVHRDWYYLNYHRAIDSIKYRMYKLNKHVESLGAPTTEKKDRICPRCKSQYTDLEALDNLDHMTGAFLCKRCGHELDQVKEEENANENEIMKRLNSQLEKILRLMQQIDATTVPENDFQTALSKQKPIIRSDNNPGQQRTEVVDLPNNNIQSTKGLATKPEKIAVQVQDDETVKKENEAAEAQARREKEARQNALPEWIATSTLTGDLTTVGAKEQRQQREREAHASETKKYDPDSKKAEKDGEKDVMDAYFKELARAQAEEAARAEQSDDDDDDDDDDEFEDVDVGAGSAPQSNGAARTPAQISSGNGTEDEREAKRVRIDESSYSSTKTTGVITTDATPAASDEDEDDLEFENV